MRRPGVRALGVAALAATVVAVAVLGQLRDPGPTVDDDPVGNPALRAAAAPLVADGRDSVAVALVTPVTTAFAYFDAEPDDEYEIASLTKPMTGALLADAIERGEVDADTEVGTLLDELDGTDVGEVTLADLATHHSGLSLFGPRTDSPARWFNESVLAGNPHAVTDEVLLAQAAADPLEFRDSYHYSNLGFGLLGAALESATGLDYPTLLRQRVVEPTGMERTRVGTASDRNQRRGFTEGGRRSAPWNLDALAPAGGVRSTIPDMAAWARSLLGADGTGLAAMEPARSEGSDGSGFGWNTRSVDGRDVVWKTGMTGGFASFAAIDRSEGRAVVVLSNTARPFDDGLIELLEAGR